MKRFLFILFPLLLIISFSLLFYWWKDNLQEFNSKNPATKIFIIQNGESVKSIAANLEKNNLIKNSLAFLIYIKLNNLQNKIQAGDFRLSQSFNLEKIINELQHGTLDIIVTIPEGLRKEEIAKIISDKMGIAIENFIEVAEEGYMFPDTYFFPKNSNAKNIADIMKNNFNKRLSSIEGFNPNETVINGMSLQEIIIMASIVEREAKYDEDRPIVAGILIKRLKTEWPLEVDAALQYALGYSEEEKKWWRNNITVSDLEIDSPFNTRNNKGLPPSPICNPGLSVIKSVIYPQTSDYWFYLSDKTGKMHYGKTIEQHTDNIKKYL